MIRFCAAHIYELRKMPEFVKLLEEFGELGASILQVENIGLKFEGCWHYCGDEDRRAFRAVGNAMRSPGVHHPRAPHRRPLVLFVLSGKGSASLHGAQGYSLDFVALALGVSTT